MSSKNIDFEFRGEDGGTRFFVEKEPGSTENSIELIELDPRKRYPPTGHIVNPGGETLVVRQEGSGFVQHIDSSPVTLLEGKIVRIPRNTPFFLSSVTDRPLWALVISTPAQKSGYLPRS